MRFLEILYPTVPDRIPRSHSFWDGKKKGFAAAITGAFILLQLLFLGNLSYLFGSLFRDAERAHNLNVLMVDFDGDIVGQSMIRAAEELQADTFPGIHSRTVLDYPSPSDLVHAVRNGDYWAAVYTHSGASQRLATALGDGSAAGNYNASDTVTYVFNGVRYPTVANGFLQPNMETLISVMRLVYNQLNGTKALLSGSIVNEASAQVLFNPFMSTHIDIKPTTQGTRVLLNTVAMILPIIQQFFFLMALNGISAQFKFYRHLAIKHNAAIRFILGVTYTFFGSLCMTGYIWAFREDWNVSGGQFMLTWMLCWLYQHIMFLVMDTATGFVPMSFLSFFVLTWAIMNITTTIFPFDLSPGFYHWGYFFPAHSAWETLINIWSGGGYHRLYRTLPVLFSWWIVMIPLAKSAMHWRCVAAVKMDDAHVEPSGSLHAEDKHGALESTSHLTTLTRGSVDMTNIAGHDPYMPMPFGDTLAGISQHNNKSQINNRFDS